MSPESLIASSKVAAVVSDPRQPDNPIVACNEAFMQLTGYPKEEILGRNCRFLRGERTVTCTAIRTRPRDAARRAERDGALQPAGGRAQGG